jgi:hypothetical protein
MGANHTCSLSRQALTLGLCFHVSACRLCICAFFSVWNIQMDSQNGHRLCLVSVLLRSPYSYTGNVVMISFTPGFLFKIHGTGAKGVSKPEPFRYENDSNFVNMARISWCLIRSIPMYIFIGIIWESANFFLVCVSMYCTKRSRHILN